MQTRIMFLLPLLLAFSCTESAKILVYNPKFGVSHMTFAGKIADTLAAAGHEIVVYQPTINENITLTGSKHESIRYYTKAKNSSIHPDFSVDTLQSRLWEKLSLSFIVSHGVMLYSVKYDFCVDFLNDKETLEKLKNEKFDLGMTELFEPCGFGIFEAIGLKKYITTTGGTYTMGQMEAQSIPIPFSYTPKIMSADSDEEWHFFQRFKNMAILILENFVMDLMLFAGSEKAIAQEIDPSFNMKQAIKKSAFLFVNTDEILDYTLPATPKAIFIGGMGKVQSKPLEKKYVDIFSNSKNGVILFSFGSVAKSASMPPEMKQAFLDAFAEFPEITFLWKYELDDDVGRMTDVWTQAIWTQAIWTQLFGH